jgi:hypothetical protein
LKERICPTQGVGIFFLRPLVYLKNKWILALAERNEKRIIMAYTILLDTKTIGTSELESSDSAMGVVFGEIAFNSPGFDYAFFSKYCKDNKIATDEEAKDKLILTRTIPALSVMNEGGIGIECLGCYIGGNDKLGYEINIEGIPQAFFEEEFPQHVKTEEEGF